jgi:urocanate hydratase
VKKGYFDQLTEKLISRKLLVFLTATGLMLYSDLTSDTWGMIAIVYIGTQGAVDAMMAYKFGRGD